MLTKLKIKQFQFQFMTIAQRHLLTTDHREDDGVVVFACLGTDYKEPSTHLVVLEPENLQELGRFSVPYTSAVGFHGIWIN